MRLRLLPVALVVAGGVCISAATWVVFRHGVVATGAGLPTLGTVPDFSLVSSSGQPLSRADLAGGVWVADFIFTRCGSICPTLSGQMARLQGTLAGEHQSVRLVSFSVDPTHDTPAVLREYGDRFRADGKQWWFATGDRAALHALIGDGFHLAVAERPESANADGEGLITHSDRFVLVDRDLQIRGYYHGTDEDSIKQLVYDIRLLTQQPSAINGQQLGAEPSASRDLSLDN